MDLRTGPGAFVSGVFVGGILAAGLLLFAPGGPGARLADARRHSEAALVALDGAIFRSGSAINRAAKIEYIAGGIAECARELYAITGGGPEPLAGP